jgi:hypothetical protein
MALPTTPVTLTVEQVGQLNKTLSEKRHEVNNVLCVIAAAVDLVRINPAQTPKMLAMIAQRAPEIKGHIEEFSRAFEAAMGITGPARFPAPPNPAAAVSQPVAEP